MHTELGKQHAVGTLKFYLSPGLRVQKGSTVACSQKEKVELHQPFLWSGYITIVRKVLLVSK